MGNLSEKVNGGRRPGAGRKPGVPNKIQMSVKEMVLGALHELGGQKWLKKVAAEDPKAFIPLITRCMPTVIAGDPENPLSHAVAFLPEKTPFSVSKT